MPTRTPREPPAAHELRSVGFGPAATGPGPGWSMSRSLWARCPECGALLSLDPATTETCPCGGLHKDGGAARFGSRRGDDAVEILTREVE